MPVKGQRVPVRDRFQNKFDRCESGCWRWKSASTGRYGIIWIADGKSQYAHRVSYELHKGPIPKGLYVCHTCDNGHCVNPDHLFLGTSLDNSNDKWNKGRGPNHKGERNPAAKLSSDQVVEMRKLREDRSLSYDAIAKRFGVSRKAASNAIVGITWRAAC